MKKTLRNDLILIISLVVVLVGSLLAVLLTRKKSNLVAKIYVKDELRLTINLSEQDKEFEIDGVKGKLTISLKDHAIGVIEADCPHQDCVHMGFVKESNRPIICAYNQVYIIIEGNSNYDISI